MALGTLNRYRFAYRERDVDSIKKVYPSLPREEGQRLDKNFRNCSSVDVSFADVQASPLAQDATTALVTARSTYICQPKVRAPALEQSQDDVFRLRKVNDVWLIENMGSMDSRRR